MWQVGPVNHQSPLNVDEEAEESEWCDVSVWPTQVGLEDRERGQEPWNVYYL